MNQVVENSGYLDTGVLIMTAVKNTDKKHTPLEGSGQTATSPLGNSPALGAGFRNDFFASMKQSREWTQNPNFIRYVLRSIRPDDTYYLPRTIDEKRFLALIAQWNSHHAPIFQVYTPREESLLKEYSFPSSPEEYSALSSAGVPTRKLIDLLSCYDNRTAPEFNRQIDPIDRGWNIKIPRNPLFDKDFQSWVTKRINIEKNEKFITRLADCSISQNDLDWLVDRYNGAHPGSSLIKPSLSTGEKIPTNTVFRELKIERKLPPLPESLVPVALYFAAGRGSSSKNVLSPAQRIIVVLIEDAIGGKHLDEKSYRKMTEVVATITPYMTGDSPISQLRGQLLRNALKENYRQIDRIMTNERKGATSFNGKPINAAMTSLISWGEEINNEIKHLPAGTGAYRLSKLQAISELLEGGGASLETVQKEILGGWKKALVSAVDDGSFWQNHPKLFDLVNHSTDPAALFQELDTPACRRNRNFSRLYVNTSAALKYAKECAEKSFGYVSAEQRDIERAIACGEAWSLYCDKTGNFKATPEEATKDLGKLEKLIKKENSQSRQSVEFLQKGTSLTVQTVASIVAVTGGQLEALPIIWAAPFGLSTLTRAYVEDTSLCHSKRG